MPIDRVVVKASPLIALFKSGQAQLLPALFGTIYVPDAVWREVVSEEHEHEAARGPAIDSGLCVPLHFPSILSPPSLRRARPRPS